MLPVQAGHNICHKAKGDCSGADIHPQRLDLRVAAAAQREGYWTALWPDHLLQVSLSVLQILTVLVADITSCQPCQSMHASTITWMLQVKVTQHSCCFEQLI